MSAAPSSEKPAAPLDSVESDTDLVRVQRFSVVVMVAWGAFALLHLVTGRQQLAAIHGAAFVAVGLGAWISRRAPQRMRLGLNLVAGGSLASLMVIAIFTGGPRGSAMGYLSLLPLVTGLFRLPSQRFVWLVLGVSGMATVPILASLVPPESQFDVGSQLTDQVSSGVILSLLLFRFGSEWRASSDAQAALLRARHETIEEQARALRQARDEALSASEQKSRFVAMTSHELRGPLNGILGMSDALSRTRLGEHQHELVRALSTSADSLSRLLADLLDVARIEAGKLDVVVGPTDVRELLSDVADAFAAQASAKGIEIASICAASVPPLIEADAGRLGQVLRNLTSNAVKFTDVGTVLLEARRERDAVILSVIDSGKGIEAEDVSRIFAPFEQVSADLVDRRAGTGLGLWIARNLVESWGGTIEVESKRGRGTAFHVTMPVGDVGRPSVEQTARGLPRLIVITKRAMTARAFESVGREIDAQVDVRTTVDEIVARARVDARALVVDVESVDASAIAALGRLRLGKRLVLAANVTRIADCERLAAESGARVLLLPVRASRVLHALEEPSEPSPADASQPRPEGRPGLATLLVVDDDAINRWVVRHAAERLGLKVIEAESGRNVLGILETTKVDVLLLDLHMAGGDGDEVAAEIRRALGAAAPVMVAYTGSVQESDRRRLLSVGIQEILTKPLDRGAFSATLERALHARRRKERGSVSFKLDALDPRALVELEAILGNPADVSHMLEEFVPQLGVRIQKLGTHVDGGDLKGVEGEAHSLAAVSATFGAAVVSRIARSIESFTIKAREQAGSEDPMPRLRGLRDELEAAGREANVLLLREVARRKSLA